MFGVEIWIIFQDRDNIRYYYQGTENRGRRVWTRQQNKAYPFPNKEEALNAWENKLNCTGSVVGAFL